MLDQTAEVAIAGGGRGGTGPQTRRGDSWTVVEVPAPAPGDAKGMFVKDEGGLQAGSSRHRPAGRQRRRQRRRARRRGRAYTIASEVVIPREDGTGPGALGWAAKKVMKVLVFKVVDAAGKWIGDKIARDWEAENRRPRLRGFAPGTHCQFDVPALAPSRPGQAGRRPVAALHPRHDEPGPQRARTPTRCLPGRDGAALRRPGVGLRPSPLSVNPTENAVWLAQQLQPVLADGRSMEVDIVSHSRGGLVGRVLAEQPEKTGLGDRLSVGKLVMVATLNAGTPLADQRHVGALVDRVTNLMSFLPDNGITDVLDVVVAALRHLAAGALSGLDGLQSMNRNAEWLTKLNATPSNAACIYRAIASNYDPGGDAPLARLARDAVFDTVFKGEENDLIVPRAGVAAGSGAGKFPVDAPMEFVAAQAVDHSGYWANTDVHAKLAGWLTG